MTDREVDTSSALHHALESRARLADGEPGMSSDEGVDLLLAHCAQRCAHWAALPAVGSAVALGPQPSAALIDTCVRLLKAPALAPRGTTVRMHVLAVLDAALRAFSAARRHDDAILRPKEGHTFCDCRRDVYVQCYFAISPHSGHDGSAPWLPRAQWGAHWGPGCPWEPMGP